MLTPFVNFFILILLYRTISQKLLFDTYEKVAYFIGALIPFFVLIFVYYLGYTNYILNYQWIMGLPMMSLIFSTFFLFYYIKSKSFLLSQFCLLPLIGISIYTLLNIFSANNINSLSPIQLSWFHLNIFHETYLIYIICICTYFLLKKLIPSYAHILNRVFYSVLVIVFVYFVSIKMYTNFQIQNQIGERQFISKPLDNYGKKYLFKSLSQTEPIIGILTLNGFDQPIIEQFQATMSTQIQFDPKIKYIYEDIFLVPQLIIKNKQNGDRIIEIAEKQSIEKLIQLEQINIQYNQYAEQLSTTEVMQFFIN